MPQADSTPILHQARATLELEAQALLALAQRINGNFCAVVQQVLQLAGRVVVMGMGKSGHVARKIAATLASTGTPAFFVHPAEASHGDLGMVTKTDLVLALSNSGETAEITALLPTIKRQGIPLVAMTGKLHSTLARHANWILDSHVAREACPLNLAPTASTTAQMALGDALAMALLRMRGFAAEDFARSHPGGALGRKLLTHVRDVMHSGADLPRVPPAASLPALIHEISAKTLGCAAVVDAAGRVQGMFTDGDLRRHMEALMDAGGDLRGSLRAEHIMQRQPHTIAAQALASEAARLMEEHGITAVLVVDAQQRLEGIVHIRDLMRAGVI